MIFVAVATAGCRSIRGSVANVMEPCDGYVARADLVILRDMAVHELLNDVFAENGCVVVTRAMVIDQPLLPTLSEAVAKIIGHALAKTLLDQRPETECWPQGAFSLRMASDLARAEEGDWRAFRAANPSVTGVVTVGKPAICRDDHDAETAAMLIDFRCGDSCGGLWLLAFERHAASWRFVRAHGLLTY